MKSTILGMVAYGDLECFLQMMRFLPLPVREYCPHGV
jgi:hypothetical protein